jgi:glutathione S-transferase
MIAIKSHRAASLTPDFRGDKSDHDLKMTVGRKAVMLQLYNSVASTCSQKVRLTLAEKSLDFEDRQISLKDNEQLSDWYLKINPNGVVPTLVHDGNAVIDSSVINEYLDEVFPAPSLVPANAHLRASMRAWRQYIDEVPTPAIRIPSFNTFIVPTWNRSSKGWGEDRISKSPLRKSFLRRIGPSGFSKEDVDDATEKLTQTCERMERSLEAGPWLIGEQFTLADISLIPTLVRMSDIGLEGLWRDRPHVADWFERVRVRPSFSATFVRGSRLSIVVPLAAPAVAEPC